MRASCSICQELFTSDLDVCAVPCGHIFHLQCVEPWFRQNNTCPQCREKVLVRNMIRKLYFTETEVEDAEMDSNKLKNELDDLRMRIRDKDKSISELRGEQNKQQERLSALRLSLSDVQDLYKVELTKNQTLKKELLCYKRQQDEAERARREAIQLREKLQQLQNLDALRNGLMSDIEERARNSNVKDLAEWVVIQEKEMKRKRIECRQLKENLDKLQRECKSMRKCVEVKSKEYKVLEERLKLSEDDVKRVEEQNTGLKKKMDALQQSIASTSSAGSGFAFRLINESPAPQPGSKRPRLSEPGPELSFNLSDTPHSTSPPPVPPKKPEKQLTECRTKYIKLSSGFKEKTNQTSIGSFNILKKTTGTGFLTEKNSTIRVGYNGLGGHTKFVQPKGCMKGQSDKKKGVLSGSNKPNIPPPLPSIDF